MKTAYKTRQQDLLLSYLKEIKGNHFTAEDLCNHFEKLGTPVGAATIYRHLEKLVLDGSVQKYVIDEHSAACFEYIGECKDRTENEQHFHLKCEHCGKLIHLECDELEKIQAHLLAEHGFVLNPLRTVFYGSCDECKIKKQ